MRAGERNELRAAWRFSARYLDLLSGLGVVGQVDPGLQLIDGAGLAIPTSTTPEAGKVWIRVREVSGRRVLNLVDLRAQSDDRWDTGRDVSPRNSGWRLMGLADAAPVAASPWTAAGAAAALRPDVSGGWRLPSFRRWLMVVERPA